MNPSFWIPLLAYANLYVVQSLPLLTAFVKQFFFFLDRFSIDCYYEYNIRESMQQDPGEKGYLEVTNEQHSESREDYLESILILKAKKGAVRSIDIAEHFNYSRPSISRAMSLLRSSGLITMDNSGYIELTEKGMQKARWIYERHNALIAFLEKLGVSPETAELDGCRIEHILSEESMECIRRYLQTESA